MEQLEVMEPILSEKIVTGTEWIHQVKWDGIRGITYIDNKQIKLLTKNGRERADYYPELKSITSLFHGKQAVLDGEIIVFDAEGKPSFDLVLHRERLRTMNNLNLYMKKYPVHYIVFDMLYLDGRDLRKVPLTQRKNLLEHHLQRSSCITITDDFPDGNELFSLMKQKSFEGIVSKQKDSPYISGKKHSQWFKTKINKKILAVVGGISWKAGYPNSLLLGIYHQQRLYYVGNASSGLTQNDFRLLKEYTSSLGQSESPFANLDKGKDTTWFKPLLTCWVSFLEWTDKKSLRHPKILGFSNQPPTEATGKETIVE